MEPFTDKCLQVVLHEGTPSGSFRTAQGHRIYVATPGGSYAKDAAVVICTGQSSARVQFTNKTQCGAVLTCCALCWPLDLFGVDLVNNLLIADSFAAAGFQTYIRE